MYYTQPAGLALLYNHYTHNNLYIYPEHRDHDPGQTAQDRAAGHRGPGRDRDDGDGPQPVPVHAPSTNRPPRSVPAAGGETAWSTCWTTR